MGWFNKDKKEEKEEVPSLPELPELPKLPVLPEMNEGEEAFQPVHQLPSFPASSLGEKFSQNAIKEAVSGRRRGAEVTDELEEEPQMMREPLRLPRVREVPEGFIGGAARVRKIEPVFIRIDKFENSMKTFAKIKEKIMEIEEMLKDIKKIKENEEAEFSSWENEIESLKQEIERIDQDIFSKIE